MCCWMLWGCAQYFAAECAPPDAPAAGDLVLAWARCNAWLAWVALNAAFHLFWVTVLLCCQLYLVSAPAGPRAPARASRRAEC